MGRGSLDTGQVRAILAAFDASDWQELRVVIGDTVVHVARSSAGLTLSGSDDAVGMARVTADGGAPARVDPVSRTREGRSDRPEGFGPVPADVSATEAVATSASDLITDSAALTTSDASQAATTSDDVVIRSPMLGIFWRAPHPSALAFVEVGDTVTPGITLCIVEVMKLMTPVKAGVTGVVAEILADNGQSLTRDQELFRIRTTGP